MKDLDLVCDVAIIGAGVTGLYAARCLHALLPQCRIHIFERNGAAGGRILSVPLAASSGFVDLGAVRYSMTKHPRLHYLVQQLGIKCAPFSYHTTPFQNKLSNYAQEKFRKSFNDLKKFFSACSQENKEQWSFWEGACKCLGSEKSYDVIAASGYSSLRHPKFSFKQGLDVLLNHPETESLTDDTSGKWVAPVEGFQSIPRSLANALQPTCAIHYHHHLVSIEQTRANLAYPLCLRFSTDMGNKVMRAHQVVYASALQDFLDVDGCDVSQAIIRNIIAVPLFKGYAEYAVPWWQSMDIAGHCLTNASGLGKIYFPKHASYVLVYADGENAVALKTLFEDPDNSSLNFETALREAIPLNCAHQDVPIPIKKKWQFWEKGISLWGVGLNFLPKPFWSYASNIHLCTDLCTDHAGWIEGGIVSAEAAARQIAHLLEPIQNCCERMPDKDWGCAQETRA